MMGGRECKERNVNANKTFKKYMSTVYIVNMEKFGLYSLSHIFTFTNITFGNYVSFM